MMASSTHCSRNAAWRAKCTARWLQAWLRGAVFFLGLMASSWAQTQHAIQLQTLSVQRAETQIVLSANWTFELPPALEDALLKGVPLYFIAEAEVMRERWYFYDKRVGQNRRYLRLAYQPLTQRWRVHVSSQPIAGVSSAGTLGQNFDSLDDALVMIRRLSQWPLMPSSDLEADARHKLALSFRLDLTQLPRPLQIGLAEQSEWNLAWSQTQRLAMDTP